MKISKNVREYLDLILTAVALIFLLTLCYLLEVKTRELGKVEKFEENKGVSEVVPENLMRPTSLYSDNI